MVAEFTPLKLANATYFGFFFFFLQRAGLPEDRYMTSLLNSGIANYLVDICLYTVDP